MAPQIPGFFKIILRQNIHSNKLELPTKFTIEHGDELSDAAQLVVSDGQIWEVGLTREGNQISLSNGFDDFARHYPLNHGHLLVFKYKGMSSFSVSIYYQTNCQISYPSHNPRTGENQRSTPNFDSGYTSKCGIPTPRHFRSERPRFETKLKKHNFDHNNSVYIPRVISESIGEAQVEKGFIWLETSHDGRRWKASLHEISAGRTLIVKLKDFYKYYNLKENDICIVEFVEEELLKVFIFPEI